MVVGKVSGRNMADTLKDAIRATFATRREPTVNHVEAAIAHRQRRDDDEDYILVVLVLVTGDSLPFEGMKT